MTVLVIENAARVPIGRLGEVMTESGISFETVAMYAGTEPKREDWDAVVILGGEMGAYESLRCPWLDDEMEFIRWAIAEEIPVLGICLGSQLIAHATGGKAYLAEQPEVGFVDLELTEPGSHDPVVSTLDAPVLAVHRDTFDLPPGATALAASDRYVHAYRLGSALAIQFHPEADREIVARWIAEGGVDAMAVQADTSVEAFALEVAEHETEADESARRLFRAWLESDVGVVTRTDSNEVQSVLRSAGTTSTGRPA